MNHTRQYTIKAMNLVDNGFLTWQQLAESCLLYLSDEDVYRLMQSNDFFFNEETEFEDEDTSYTVPEDVNEIFETFSDFKACVISAFPDIVEKGEFIDDSEAYEDDVPKRRVYYWASLPKYGTQFVEYDTGAVKNFRWTILMEIHTAMYQGTRKAFGPNLREAIDNLYTCPILNQ